MKFLLDRFSPGLSARFNIESILALVVENTFPDRRTVPVTCHCNLSLTTGSVEQSKNACKGSALHNIHHTLHALVHTIHTPLSR